MLEKSFQFKAKVWLTPGHAGWHFVTLPQDTSEQVDFYFKEFRRGWESLPVKATTGNTDWRTSIFYDSKKSSYILPIKLEVRKLENIVEDDTLNFTLLIKD